MKRSLIDITTQAALFMVVAIVHDYTTGAAPMIVSVCLAIAAAFHLGDYSGYRARRKQVAQ